MTSESSETDLLSSLSCTFSDCFLGKKEVRLFSASPLQSLGSALAVGLAGGLLGTTDFLGVQPKTVSTPTDYTDKGLVIYCGTQTLTLMTWALSGSDEQHGSKKLCVRLS